MEVLLEGAALAAAAFLGGMETVFSIWAFEGKKEAFNQVWNSRLLCGSAAVWLILLAGAWYGAAAAGGGISRLLPQPGYLTSARIMALFLTYILLAAVDGRRRIVPDRILACYLAGQLLMAAAGMDDGWIRCLIEGTVFALFLAAVSWFLKGRFGMGDAKLLGATAMTAGWTYSLQVLFTAMALAFFAGVWLLLFRKMSAKTEMPFVPFLAAGMAVHFFMLLKL